MTTGSLDKGRQEPSSAPQEASLQKRRGWVIIRMLLHIIFLAVVVAITLMVQALVESPSYDQTTVGWLTVLCLIIIVGSRTVLKRLAPLAVLCAAAWCLLVGYAWFHPGPDIGPLTGILVLTFGAYLLCMGLLFLWRRKRREPVTLKLMALVAALVPAEAIIFTVGYAAGLNDSVPWHPAPHFAVAYLLAGMSAALMVGLHLYRTRLPEDQKGKGNPANVRQVVAIPVALTLLAACLLAFGDALGFSQGQLEYFPPGGVRPAKPVIYLYPPRPELVTVRVLYSPGFAHSGPPYNPGTGWSVLAYPDGALENLATGKNYPYLYWEGNPGHFVFNMHTGFVVPSADTATFLRYQLQKMGLNQTETASFLQYWGPRLEHGQYNLIHFATTGYTSKAPLQVYPMPQSVLRIFMVYEPLADPVTVTPQQFPVFHRSGFTLVEWGGTKI